MGQPKLLLPFGETTVIGRLIRLLQAEKLADVLVLVRPDDAALAAEVRKHGARVVQPPSAPQEMRVSVEHLLDAIEQTGSPTPADGWLLIPGDHPLVSPSTLRQLITEWHDHPASIVLPVAQHRRGHPTIFPWSFAEQVRQLSPDVGVNHLLRGDDTPLLEIPVDDPTILLDLDTPEDYQRAIQKFDG